MTTALPVEVAAPSLRSSSLRRHHPIGASTGYFSDLRGSWREQLDAAGAISPFAIEVSALSEPELISLLDFLREDMPLPFRYLSIHGPAKERELPELELVEMLLTLPENVDAIVMHPDTIDDPALYMVLGSRLVIENMDTRKPTGQTANDLAPLFSELPEAGFCFDAAHAHSVDVTLAVANELLDAFGARLRHLHVSSLSEKLHHVPLSYEDAAAFLPLLSRCLDVPWIFEAFERSD
jgi:hypothetical protein